MPTIVINTFKRFGIACALVLLSLPGSAATSVVILLTKTRIVIAADSRQTLYGTAVFRNVCKILVRTDFVYTSAGFGKDAKYLDAANTASQLPTGILIEEQIAMYKKEVTNGLNLAMHDIPKETLKNVWKVTDGQVLQVLFVKANGTGIQRFLIGFDLVGTVENFTVQPYSVPIADEDTVLFFGHWEAIGGYKPQDIIKIGWTEGPKQLVQKEIDAEPNEVGPPIQIVDIDTKGYKWVQCESPYVKAP